MSVAKSNAKREEKQRYKSSGEADFEHEVSAPSARWGENLGALAVCLTSRVIAPDLSRAVRLASLMVRRNPNAGFAKNYRCVSPHGAAQIRRGRTFARMPTHGAPRFSPHRTLGPKTLASLVLPLLNDLHFQVIPERFWNLNAAIGLLVGLD
jgi:hypothetical protein